MTTNRILSTAVLLALATAPLTAVAGSPIDSRRAASATARIEVENVRGRIEVHGWDRNEVAVAGTLGEGSKLEFTGTDDHLQIRIESPDAEGWSWWGNSGPKEDTILQVSVPLAAALEVGAVSADVRIDGIVGAKELEAESVSGDVEVHAGAQRVEVGSVSGDVTLRTSGSKVELETVSGDIDAEGPSGVLRAESVSGRITLEAGKLDELEVGTVSGDVTITTSGLGSGRVKIESLSGDVDLEVPADLSARISVESFSGQIRSDFGEVEDEEGPGSSLRTTAGKGDAQINLESFSGDVQIRRH